jgi:hypothetical protein
MRADLRRARDQKSTSSHGAGATFWIGFALCAVLAAAGCKGANFAKPDGGGGRDGNASDVAQPNTCPPEIPSQSKGKAQSCSCDRECQTGFCVDGICCNEACTETCKACDLPSSLGVCAPVPSGVKPSVALQCVASSPATCGLDGTCDGNGGCRKFEKETPCKAGTCDGDGVTGILTCDGNGNCSDPISKICEPWTCDPTTSDCTHDCATDAQCSPGHQCVSGRCGKSPNGAFCDTADQCDSGFCADGVCCSLACSSSCMSCNQTGSVGHCAPIPAGQHDPACGGGDPTTCGNTGVCDGFGSCTLYPKDTVCGPSSCSGLSENTPRTCDGQGTCGDSHPLDCSPFLCTNTACATVCKLDSDCAPGNQCVLKTVNGVTTGSCGPKQNGQSCASPSECLSSQCVDGVCCENSCAGACQSCNLPSSPGRCLNVANNAPDQHNICQDLGATSCVTNGLCDGNGACQNYPAATQCSQETCVAGLHTPASQCDGSGKCVPSDPISCDPYVCNGPTCFKSCTSSSIQCISGKFCTNASCGPKPNGAECSLGTECLSTFCAQGACCDSACLGACMNCNLKAAPGHCTAVADKSQDPQNICTAKSSDTCGTTGTCLGGKCADYDKGTNCKAASCATTSSVTSASTCDGNGSCVQGGVYTCVNQTCVSGSCQGQCGPGQVQCSSNNGVQTCTTTGSWGAAVSCSSQACVGGACTGKCAPGDKQCSGNGVQTCGGDGQWPTSVSPCSNQTCSGGQCKGICAPGTQCSSDNKGVLTCGSDGTWPTTASSCPNNACAKGACSDCIPASTKCSSGSTGVLKCTDSGTWPTTPSSCTNNACVAGGCTDCLPNATKCSASSLQTCTSAGAWPVAVACPNGNICANATQCATDCSISHQCAAGSFCDGSTCHAGATCAASPGCASGFYCDGTASCKATLAKGIACTGNLQCSTGLFCADSVCCDSACTGACMACKLSGTVGTCTPVTSGTDNQCPVICSGSSITSGLCGTASGAIGKCASATACPNGNICSSGTACASDCSGSGSCAANYYCDGAACQSGSSCTSAPGCKTGFYCDTGSGTCKSEGGLGTGCSGNAQCTSGFCVDGVCCNNQCGGACMACNLSGSPGTCSPVTSGADSQCPASCSGSSITNGQCGAPSGGIGKCASATACPNGNICSSGTACASDCSGSGNCAANYYCDGAACQSGSSCTSTPGCKTGFYCDTGSGTCKSEGGLGTSCVGGAQCASGYCVSNICCNTACPGTGPCDTNQCGAGGTGCQQYTDGTHQCGSGIPSCSPDHSGILSGSATCGSSGCVAATPASCSPYLCVTSTVQCSSSCTIDTDCASDCHCDTSLCVANH